MEKWHPTEVEYIGKHESRRRTGGLCGATAEGATLCCGKPGGVGDVLTDTKKPHSAEETLRRLIGGLADGKRHSDCRTGHLHLPVGLSAAELGTVLAGMVT